MKLALLLIALCGFLLGLTACETVPPPLGYSMQERWEPGTVVIWRRAF